MKLRIDHCSKTRKNTLFGVNHIDYFPILGRITRLNLYRHGATMNLRSASYISQPEIQLADRLLRLFPEATKIYASELERFFDWKNPMERELYRGYHEAALEVLVDLYPPMGPTIFC